ncbi:sushi domain-containing protein 2-like [Mercenaria mercenaria]|uniref:sushi domain-containing protein 2-like n=1 Tax=Mercenaria mercenaria TaxID=6596 RepID=UPI00234F6C86|nr:sushi domain-containing protein 2-like [Mercenaria mercenaria]
MKELTNGLDIMFSNAGAPRRYKVIYLVWLLILFLGKAKICAGVALDDFYPFDIDGQDNKTEYKDDGGSELIQLDVDFPFFNYTYSSLYVNNNGIISFVEKLKSYKPLNFNDKEFKDDIPIVAPFWADVDMENFRDVDLGECVVYRVTNDSALLNRSAEDIREHFAGQKDFTAKQMIIVTWYKVGFYGAAGDGKTKRNTFQAVLVTSGVKSFAIFSYNKIVWTTGSNSGGGTDTGLADTSVDTDAHPAVVGFSSGDLQQYYLLEYSGTDEIINIGRRSNIGIPGKYIFRLDGTVDDQSCGGEKIEIFPSSVSMLGREAIRVTGPCLSEVTEVKARIRELNLEFNCHVIQDQSALCVIPSLFRTGDLTFDFLQNGERWEYSTTITSENIMNIPAKIVRQQVTKWDLNKKVTVSWDLNSAPRHKEKTLDVLGYIAHIDEEEPRFEIVQNYSGLLTETYTFKLLSEMIDTQKLKLNSRVGVDSLVMRLCWMDEHHPKTLPVCIWSDVFPVRWKSSNSIYSEQWCEDWLNSEQNFPPITLNPPSCPCIASMAGNDSGHFQKDPLCDIDKSSVNTNCVYNPNAHKCYRRNLRSVDGSGTTCCYNKQGNLMDVRKYPGSGTHQRYHYRAQGYTAVPFFSYFESDLLPRLHCCQYSDKHCKKEFVKYRPATTCQDYKPPSPAQAAGDPHLVTLDGKSYSFNGVGDFYLVTDQNSSIVIQVRAEPARDNNGELQNATVFSSIAVAMPLSSDTVEIRKTGEGSEVLVNSAPFTTTKSTTSQFQNISLLHNDDGSFLIVLEPVSVSVTVEVTPDLLNIIVLIGEDSLKGEILGLLGNYNGNSSDDFIARNRTMLRSSSSMRDIHFDFGLTWKVPQNESIMSSPPMELSADINFQPVFIDEQSEETVRNGTYEICGTNLQCKFDYSVTGKESVAKSTAQFTNKFEALKKELDQKVVRCPYLDTPTNGNMTQNGDSEGAVATFTCDTGYEMIGGTATRVCQENNVWSGSVVICAAKVADDGEGFSQKIVIVATVSATGGIVLILIVSVVVCCMRRRRKSKPSSVEMTDINNIPIFQNPAFMKKLQDTVADGPFRIPRPKYADPSIFVDYF